MSGEASTGSSSVGSPSTGESDDAGDRGDRGGRTGDDRADDSKSGADDRAAQAYAESKLRKLRLEKIARDIQEKRHYLLTIETERKAIIDKIASEREEAGKIENRLKDSQKDQDARSKAMKGHPGVEAAARQTEILAEIDQFTADHVQATNTIAKLARDDPDNEDAYKLTRANLEELQEKLAAACARRRTSLAADSKVMNELAPLRRAYDQATTVVKSLDSAKTASVAKIVALQSSLRHRDGEIDQFAKEIKSAVKEKAVEVLKAAAGEMAMKRLNPSVKVPPGDLSKEPLKPPTSVPAGSSTDPAIMKRMESQERMTEAILRKLTDFDDTIKTLVR